MLGTAFGIRLVLGVFPESNVLMLLVSGSRRSDGQGYVVWALEVGCEGIGTGFGICAQHSRLSFGEQGEHFSGKYVRI